MVEPAVGKRKKNLVRFLLLFSPSIFVFAVVVYPFLVLVHGNMGASFFDQLTGNSVVSGLTRKAIYNSLLQGGVSAASSMVVGLPLGLFLGRYGFRGRKLVNSLVIVPFFLPSILVVFAFISGFGQGSALGGFLPFTEAFSRGFTGIVAANTFFNAPLVALFSMTAVEQSDRNQIEAAKTMGVSPLRRFTSIWGRNGILAATGGALLSFAYSFAGFAAPLIIGGPGYFTLDAWIYTMVKVLDNFQAAIVLALIEALILIIPALVFISFSSLRRRVTGVSVATSADRGERDGYFFAGAIYTGLWIAFELYMLSSIFLASLRSASAPWWHLPNYYELFGVRATSAIGLSAGSAIINSVFYGVVTSLVVITLGLMWMTAKRRLNFQRRFASEPVQYIPLVISAIIMAFSISFVFGIITPVNLIWVLIIVAQSAVAIPVVLRVIDAGFSAIPVTYSEAALTLRGNPLFDVELPIARTAFASALMFGFVMSLGEFSATNFLATTNYIPLTVEIYMLRNVRLFGASFAAAAILLVVSLIAFYIIQKLGERFVAIR